MSLMLLLRRAIANHQSWTLALRGGNGASVLTTTARRAYGATTPTALSPAFAPKTTTTMMTMMIGHCRRSHFMPRHVVDRQSAGRALLVGAPRGRGGLLLPSGCKVQRALLSSCFPARLTPAPAPRRLSTTRQLGSRTAGALRARGRRGIFSESQTRKSTSNGSGSGSGSGSSARAKQSAPGNTLPPPPAQGPLKRSIDRYRVLEDQYAYHGYPVLRYIVGTVAVFAVTGILIYLNREPLRTNLSDELATTARNTLENEEMVAKANQVTKDMLLALLNDQETMASATRFVTTLFSQPETRQATAQLLIYVMRDPAALQQTQQFTQWVVEWLGKDKRTQENLTQLILYVLRRPDTHQALVVLFKGLLEDPATRRNIAAMAADILTYDNVRTQAGELAKDATHRVLDDQNVKDHTVTFFKETFGDKGLQAKAGSAIWSAVGYGITPRFLQGRGKPQPVAAPANGAAVGNDQLVQEEGEGEGKGESAGLETLEEVHAHGFVAAENAGELGEKKPSLVIGSGVKARGGERGAVEQKHEEKDDGADDAGTGATSDDENINVYVLVRRRDEEGNEEAVLVPFDDAEKELQPEQDTPLSFP